MGYAFHDDKSKLDLTDGIYGDFANVAAFNSYLAALMPGVHCLFLDYQKATMLGIPCSGPIQMIITIALGGVVSNPNYRLINLKTYEDRNVDNYGTEWVQQSYVDRIFQTGSTISHSYKWKRADNFIVPGEQFYICNNEGVYGTLLDQHAQFLGCWVSKTLRIGIPLNRIIAGRTLSLVAGRIYIRCNGMGTDFDLTQLPEEITSMTLRIVPNVGMGLMLTYSDTSNVPYYAAAATVGVQFSTATKFEVDMPTS